MSTAILSESFDLRVPEDVRERLQLKPGMRFEVIPYQGQLEFVPIRHPSELRGFAKGMDTTIDREDTDRR